MQATTWLFEELFGQRIPAGELTVIAGKKGGAKSLACALIAAWGSQRFNVILSSRENSIRKRTVPSLWASDADLSRVDIPSPFPRFPSGIPKLKKQVEDDRVRLLIFEPLSGHLDPGVRRSDDSIRAIADELADLAHERECGIICGEHLIKVASRRVDLVEAIGGGSSGMPAAAQQIHIIGRDPSNRERAIIDCVKSNLGGDEEPFEFLVDARTFVDLKTGEPCTAPYLRPQGVCEFDIASVLEVSEQRQGRPPEVRNKVARWLTDFMLLKPPPHEAPMLEVEGASKEVKDPVITLPTLRQAAQKDIGMKRGRDSDPEAGMFQRGKVWWWRLPASYVAELHRGMPNEDESDDRQGA